MAAYKEFSYYYDSLMDPDFYSDYLKFIHEHSGMEPYSLEEITTRRGLIIQND